MRGPFLVLYVAQENPWGRCMFVAITDKPSMCYVPASFPRFVVEIEHTAHEWSTGTGNENAVAPAYCFIRAEAEIRQSMHGRLFGGRNRHPLPPGFDLQFPGHGPTDRQQPEVRLL